MARLARATVLVEATEDSGTRHQVEEGVKLGKFVHAQRALVETISWLRGARVGAIISWTDALEVGERLGGAGGAVPS